MGIFSGKTKIDFIGKRNIAFAASLLVLVITIFSLYTKGLNFGIDFTGGILIEARFEQNPDLAKLRTMLGEKQIGDVALQTFGDENTVLIRIGQTVDGGDESRAKIVNTIKDILHQEYGDGIDYRKVDYVGPKVGSELIKGGAISLLLSFVAMMIYIWFRFEWQYGLGGILALVHDAIATVGFFSVTQLEFNLSSIAAILTIVGYSINDSVVIYDRIRENFRKYKKMPIAELLNVSINDTLSRTILTSLTTLLALLALILVGGEVIKSFSISTFFGILVGTYSSIYISAPVLIYTKLRSESEI